MAADIPKSCSAKASLIKPDPALQSWIKRASRASGVGAQDVGTCERVPLDQQRPPCRRMRRQVRTVSHNRPAAIGHYRSPCRARFSAPPTCLGAISRTLTLLWDEVRHKNAWAVLSVSRYCAIRMRIAWPIFCRLSIAAANELTSRARPSAREAWVRAATSVRTASLWQVSGPALLGAQSRSGHDVRAVEAAHGPAPTGPYGWATKATRSASPADPGEPAGVRHRTIVKRAPGLTTVSSAPTSHGWVAPGRSR